MILPNYQEKILTKTKTEITCLMTYDKINVVIDGYARNSKTEIKIQINKNVRRRNVNLVPYITAIKDYCLSHPYFGSYYSNKKTNLLDKKCIKVLHFEGIKFSFNEFQIICAYFPYLETIRTKNCTFYKEVSLRSLKCDFYDWGSDILTLDSFNGFSGSTLKLKNTHIKNRNSECLNLNCIVLELNKVNLDYEYFFLTTTVPHLRKIKIDGKRTLKDRDLLFLSGFYNLESVQIKANLKSYQELEKLEKLREIRDALIINKQELENIKKKRQKDYQALRSKKVSEQRLKEYLMLQRMMIQNQYQDFFHKLYVPRLERVKWENKILSKDFDKIKEELQTISSLPLKERKKLSCERKEITWFDRKEGLNFDDKPEIMDYEDVLVNSNPFETTGINYYVRRKRIILNE